jgi:hypothetical protein
MAWRSSRSAARLLARARRFGAAGSAKGALDPEEFWHAWARGEAVKVDLFDPSWDFWAATHELIDTLRSRIGLAS